jgi:enamine deaminase RidA (YjgF/YER057c/UK114 family)
MIVFSMPRKTLTVILAVVLLSAMGCQSSRPSVSTADSEAMKEAYGQFGVSVSRRAGPFLYIGGMVAFNDDGSAFAPGDGKRQVELIYARVEKILAMHGATFKDVVRENSFVTNWDEFFKGAPIRIGAYDAAGAEYPAATAVEVKSLAVEGLIAEIDFIAYLGD